MKRVDAVSSMTLKRSDTSKHDFTGIPTSRAIALLSKHVIKLFRFVLCARTSLYRYVGLCATIKLVALAIFAVDWWLVRRRKQLDYTTPLSAGVGSIISLDKCKCHHIDKAKRRRLNFWCIGHFTKFIRCIFHLQYLWKRV